MIISIHACNIWRQRPFFVDVFLWQSIQFKEWLQPFPLPNHDSIVSNIKDCQSGGRVFELWLKHSSLPMYDKCHWLTLFLFHQWSEQSMWKVSSCLGRILCWIPVQKIQETHVGRTGHRKITKIHWKWCKNFIKSTFFIFQWLGSTLFLKSMRKQD